ncbi:hypothetical protein [Janthinobacterium agaricidamnosum]|uniref:Putative outer membrane domain protein n=1 Tax=Janthinobacterium agaricidamnosum NBRC 102515 = DSM 9628 TaxID=1349767 RepID=W0V263_9BURK|nr:hypothetical protein [Janthinobacterium agaricidamnosum]CDG81720.1 putative outer membrane domain protein [Janthinobacterium agaricidamnosum NBRC 102515 = DSM 9628]
MLAADFQLQRALDEQQEAAIRYQPTVLTAWHEIDDTLLAYGAVQRRRAIPQDTIVHHQDAHDAALARYQAGAAPCQTCC